MNDALDCSLYLFHSYEGQCCLEAEVVGGVECAGYPGLRDAHGVQHHVGPQPVRRVPDVVQRPGSGVAPIITRINVYSSTYIYNTRVLLLRKERPRS